MKLKKIASLMLAGVMAVSMLAGCSGNTIDDTQKPEEPDVTPSTSADAEILVAAMTKESQNRVTAVANKDLDDALQAAVDKYFNDAFAANAGRVFDIAMTGKNGHGDMRYTDLGKAVAVSMGHANDEIGDLENKLTGEGKTAVAVETYAFNASVSDDEILEQVGRKIDQSVRNLPSSSDVKVTDPYTHVTYDYDYEVSTSIVTATGKYMGIDLGVKFVSVAVVQTATEA